MAVRALRWRLGLVVLATVTLLVTACGDEADTSEAAPTLDAPDTVGRELADEFLTLLQQKDADGLAAFLSDAFILQRADGSFATKDDYVVNIPEIREYEIPAATAVQSGAVLTVRWELAVDETIEGRDFAGNAAPRLSTFAWDGEAERWRMTSHANFNVPAQ